MGKATRVSKSFTLDFQVASYVSRTRGKRSASERVNELLRRAMLRELYEKLEQEAAEFFADVSAEERKEALAFYRASLRSIKRD